MLSLHIGKKIILLFAKKIHKFIELLNKSLNERLLIHILSITLSFTFGVPTVRFKIFETK